jgi:hypothetical protein
MPTTEEKLSNKPQPIPEWLIPGYGRPSRDYLRALGSLVLIVGSVGFVIAFSLLCYTLWKLL